MSDDKLTPQEQKLLVDRQCIQSALEAAAAPLYSNRFEVIPTPDGTDTHVILTLGGVIAGEQGDASTPPMPFINVTIHGAFLITKGLAADIVARFERLLSPVEVEAARKSWVATPMPDADVVPDDIPTSSPWARPNARKMETSAPARFSRPAPTANTGTLAGVVFFQGSGEIEMADEDAPSTEGITVKDYVDARVDKTRAENDSVYGEILSRLEHNSTNVRFMA